MNDHLIEELKAELESKDETVRQNALTCLVRLGSGQSIYEIVRNISETDDSARLRYLAKRALNELNLKSRPEFQQARELIQKLLENVGEKRQKVYERVLTGNDSFLKLEMIKLLITDKLTHEQNQSENNYFLADLLKEQLGKENDLYLVAQYVKALGYFGSNRDIHLLQKLLKNKNARIVANAIEALAKLDEITAVNMVIPLLQHKDNRVRGNAIMLVHSQDESRALQELLKMISSSQVWMRSSALYCIKTLDFKHKEQYLAQMLCAENDLNIINGILDWMKIHGSKVSATALSQKIESSSDELVITLTTILDVCIERCNLDLDEINKAVLDSNILKQNNIKREIEQRAQQSGPTADHTANKDISNKLYSMLKLIFFITTLILISNYLSGLVPRKQSKDPFGDTILSAANYEDLQAYFQASNVRTRGLYREAIKRYKRLLEKYPKDSLLNLDYAETLSLMGRHKESMTHIKECSSVIKPNPRYYRVLAKSTLHSTRDKIKVHGLYQKALNLHPKNPRLLADALSFYIMIDDQNQILEIRSKIDSLVNK